MTSTDDDGSVVSLSTGSDVEDAGDEVESKIESFGDADEDEAEESAVADEEHDDTDDDTLDSVNEHDDVIGDDDDDHHSDVVEETEEAHEEESGFDEEKFNDCYDSTPEDNDNEVDGNNGGIEEIEPDGLEEYLVQDQEDPSVEDSGKECNNGAHYKPPDEHFPNKVEKLWRQEVGRKTLYIIRLWTCILMANATTLNLQ